MAVERVDKDLSRRGGRVLDEEVSRHADPADRQPSPLPHRHVEDRQRDRDSHSAIDYFVEKAIARIVVFLAIPLEVQLLEEIRVGSVDHALRLHLDADPLFQLAAHAGDLVEIDRRTHIRILFRGDQQRCLGEVQFRLRRLQQARERVACLGRRHAHIV